MLGWKTYLAVIGFALLAVYAFLSGNYEQAGIYFTSLLALFGLGHKLDKVRKEIER
jgi:hypothetical protein